MMRKTIKYIASVLAASCLITGSLWAQELKVTGTPVIQTKSGSVSYYDQLEEQYTSFELFSLPAQRVFNFTKSNEAPFLEINAGPHHWEIQLEEYNAIDDQFLFQDASTGTIQQRTLPGFRSYKGKELNKGGNVRFAFREGHFTALIEEAGKIYEIEPAHRLTKNKPDNVYLISEIKNSISKPLCGDKSQESYSHVSTKTKNVRTKSPSTCKLVDLAIFIDHEAIKTAGGSVQAAYIALDAAVKLDLTYEPAGIRYNVVTIFIGSQNHFYNDNSNSGDLDGVLQAFQDWGNRNKGDLGFGTVVFDVATMMKGSFGTGNEIGYAWGAKGDAKITDAERYNMIPFSTKPSPELWAHEIGHNWGCPHTGKNNSSSIMNESIYAGAVFLPSSLDTIANGLVKIGSKLASCGSVDAEVVSILNPGNGYLSCGTVNPIVEIRNRDLSNLTSATIKYGIEGGVINSHTWVGSLAQSTSEVITLPTIVLPQGDHRFFAEILLPNGSPDILNQNNKKVVSTRYVSNAKPFLFTINTDDKGAEISWEVQSNSVVVETGGHYYANFEGGQELKDYFCLYDSDCNSFVIKDKGNNGFKATNSYILTDLTSNTDVVSGDGDITSSKIHSDIFCSSNTSSSISLIQAIGNANCNPNTNLYSQNIEVNSSGLGKLDVNGVLYDITSSPQIITLQDLFSDGISVDIAAVFTEGNNKVYRKQNVYTAPLACSNCLPTFTESCDDNTFIKQLYVNSEPILDNKSEGCSNNGSNYTSYVEELDTVSFVGGTSYDFNINTFNGHFYRIWIDYNKDGSFDDSESIYKSLTSELTRQALNVAIPENAPLGDFVMRVMMTKGEVINSACGNYSSGEVEDYPIQIIACEIKSVLKLTTSSCDAATNLYTQFLQIDYKGYPKTGNLLISLNGNTPVSNSISPTGTANVSLSNLISDGMPVDVEVSFSDKTSCNLSVTNLFSAPSRCVCEISDILQKPNGQGICTPLNDGSSSYSQDLIVTYGGEPSSGNIVVNNQMFPITGSPQTVKMIDLIADGNQVHLYASFDQQTTCNKENLSAFIAPSDCSPCSIDSVKVTNQDACDPSTNFYSVDLKVYHTSEPAGTINVNGNTYSVDPDSTTLTLIGLISDGQDVDFSASFTNDAACSLTETALFTAPTSCASCSIDSIVPRPDATTVCNPVNNNYSLPVDVYYSDHNITDSLIVNGQKFKVTTASPQRVLLIDLDSDGAGLTISAEFNDNDQCVFTEANAFKAPVGCEPCSILDLTVGARTSCNPDNNFYTQQLVVHHKRAPETGKLVVNNQEFDISRSPQTILLDSIISTGDSVDVNINFSDELACKLDAVKFFKAADKCQSCEIDSVKVLTPNITCDVANNFHEVELQVYFKREPSSGKLEVNGQQFDFSLGSPLTVVLDSVLSDSTYKNAIISFTNDEACALYQDSLYLSPVACKNLGNSGDCSISDLALVSTTACDPSTNLYTALVDVSYKVAPSSGKLYVGNSFFDIDNKDDATVKTQRVTLDKLISNGNELDVSAYFTENVDCNLTKPKLIQAPVNCEPCQLILTKGVQTTCNGSNQYSQKFTVNFTNAPSDSSIIVNNETFAITQNEQIITLTNLTADSKAVDVSANFVNDAACTFTQANFFIAPSNCEDCEITALVKGTQTPCNPSTGEYNQDIEVTFIKAPSSGNLTVNQQSFVITQSPQTVTLSGLTSDSQSVDVTALFTDATACIKDSVAMFTAPTPCETCQISEITAGTATSCNPVTNYYTQEITVKFKEIIGYDSLVVNGKVHVVSGNSATLILDSLTADGTSQNVEAYFFEEPTCKKIGANVFTAPSKCKTCEITSIDSVRTSSCDPVTNSYLQVVRVNYEEAPSSGSLTVNGVEYSFSGNSELIDLSGLTADGNAVNVSASFTDDTQCQFAATVFTAPVNCTPTVQCSIEKIEVGTTHPCNPITNNFNQTITVYHNNAPSTGKLIVRGQEFPISNSPQTITLKNLNTNGAVYDVVVRFSDNDECYKVFKNAFIAPEACNKTACAITSVELVDEEAHQKSLCDESGEYAVEVKVDFLNKPSDIMVVNGQEFLLSQSDENTMTVVLANIKSTSTPQDVTVSFKGVETCESTRAGLFTAPDACLVGVNDQTLVKESIKLYPNPVDDKLNVEFNVDQLNDVTLFITDLSGRVIQTTTKSQVFKNFVYSYSTSHLSKGIYLLKINSDKGQLVEKFIKK